MCDFKVSVFCPKHMSACWFWTMFSLVVQISSIALQCPFQNMECCSSYMFLLHRLASIECVMILTQVHFEADKDDIVFRHQVGDVIMFFLPGIISGLQRIATADEKQGHQITTVWDLVLLFNIYTQFRFNLSGSTPFISVFNWKRLNDSWF